MRKLILFIAKMPLHVIAIASVIIILTAIVIVGLIDIILETK